jgi:hypothetical protein
VKVYYDRQYKTQNELAGEFEKEQEIVREREQKSEKRRQAENARRLSQGLNTIKRRIHSLAKNTMTTMDSTSIPDSAHISNMRNCEKDASFLVRHIANISNNHIRSFRLSHPIRAEIEIEKYGRDNLVKDYWGKRVLSVPQLTFIDAFGVYRNMYRSLTGKKIYFFYLTSWSNINVSAICNLK